MAIEFQCTEDEDDAIYSFQSKKVRVAGGTSDTPATFDDFVTADRAGTAVLLEAEACGLNHTLDEQIRPVEDLAIPITFTLAGTSAGAGDTLNVTGTDWRGAAQFESIDVSGGNGAYTGSKYWRTITDIDCTGWNDGTLKVEQDRWGFIWDYGVNQYRIDCDFEIGNGIAPTYFASRREMVVFSDNWCFMVKSQATCEIGQKYGNSGIRGSFWTVKPDARQDLVVAGGTLLLYSSILDYRANLNLDIRGVFTALNSITQGRRYDAGYTYDNLIYYQIGATLSFDSFYVTELFSLRLAESPVKLADTWVHRSDIGVESRRWNVLAEGAKTSDITYYDLAVYSAGSNLAAKNQKTPISTIFVQNDGSWIKEQYTVNIHVTDRTGGAMAGVTVVCKDQFGNQVFSEVTDGSGNIAEQVVDYRKWVDAAKTLTVYSPHEFILTKPGSGYLAYMVKDVTIDGPVNWHIQMPKGLLIRPIL